MLHTELSALRLAEPGGRPVSPRRRHMGLMDRVRAQATQIAQQAQEAAQEGKSRLDQAQAGRRGDVMLRQLGALVFAERTGRGTADSQAKIDQLISEISAHESQNGLNLADPAQPSLGQSLFGQSAWGQASGQPPAGQPAPGQPSAGPPAPSQPAQDQAAQDQSGFGQSDSGQQAPGPQPGFAAGAEAAPGQSAPPPGGTSAMPSVDTTTSFFPAPDDEDTGTPPQGDAPQG
jgi:hypothetical protein